MEDDECRILRRLSSERSEVCTQVAFDQPGLLLGGNRDRCAQSSQPTRLLRPHQRFQPTYFVGIREVDGLEIEPRPPDDARQSCRDWRRGIDRAGKDGRHQTLRLGTQNSPAIIVGVEVGEQAETGRRADFEQSQRLGKPGQHRQ